MIRLVLVSLWSLATAVVIYRLTTSHMQERTAELALAAIGDQKGENLVRGEMNVAWENAKKIRYLYDNDVISTGKTGWMKIRFREGHGIILGPNSQVRIQASRLLSDSYEVTLLQGNMNIRSLSSNRKNSGESPFLVNTGRYSFKVGAENKDFRIFKGDDKANGEVKSSASQKYEMNDRLAGRNLNLSNQQINTQVLPSVDIIAPDNSAPTTAEVQAPAVPVKSLGLVPNALSNGIKNWKVFPDNASFWYAQALPFRWSVPMLSPPNEIKQNLSSIKIMVSISSNPNFQPAWQQTIQPDQKKSLIVDFDQLQSAGLRLSDSWETKLYIATKVIAEIDGAKDEHTTPYQWQLIRPQLSRQPVALGLDLKRKSKESNSFGKATYGPQNPETWIAFSNSEDLGNLSRLIYTSRQLSMRVISDLPPEGSYFVRDGQIIAALLKTPEMNQDVIDIMRLLKSDLLFQGPRNAFLGTKDSFEANRYLSSNIPLYFIHNGSLLEIDKKLLKTHESAMEFLNTFDPIFVSQPVKVIATNPN